MYASATNKLRQVTKVPEKSAFDIVITGFPGLLAAHVVSRFNDKGLRVGYLIEGNHCDQFDELVASLHAGGHLGSSTLPTISACHPDQIAGAEIWYFAGFEAYPDRQFCDRMREAGILAITVVATPFGGGQRWQWILPKSRMSRNPDSLPDVRGFERHFRTSLTIGAAPAMDIAQEGVLHFLATLSDLKFEIDERVDDFFEYHGLRCPVSADRQINIVPVEVAAAMIVSISESQAMGDFLIAAADSMSGEDFLEIIGDAIGIGLQDCSFAPNAKPDDLDRLFDQRLIDFATYLPLPEPGECARAWSLAGMDPEAMRLDRPRFIKLVESAGCQAHQAHTDFCNEASALATERCAIDREGHRLQYSRSGSSGPVVILVNAFGQGQEAWSRLTALLSKRFRVLSWELRGLDAEHPRMCVQDHVDDLTAILDAENANCANLIAWCTGPKIALEFARQFPPRTGAMVLLNTTLKCASTPPEIDTPYERNFESLCRMLAQRPAMAPSIRDSLVAGASPKTTGNTADDEPEVLLRMNRDLRQAVLQPFRDSSSVIRYAEQLIDFWSVDLNSLCATTRPVLLLASEFDEVASPDSSELAARYLPNARAVLIPGATHYFLYDRADSVARAAEWFFSTAQQASRLDHLVQ